MLILVSRHKYHQLKHYQAIIYFFLNFQQDKKLSPSCNQISNQLHLIDYVEHLPIHYKFYLTIFYFHNFFVYSFCLKIKRSNSSRFSLSVGSIIIAPFTGQDIVVVKVQ